MSTPAAAVHRRLAWGLVAALGLVSLAGAAVRAAEQRETRQRHVLVAVTGRNDAPATDLAASDFIVREDGVAREVLQATLVTATNVVLLVDDSQAIDDMVVDVRNGVKRFVQVLAGAGPMPVVRFATFGDRPTTRVEFGTSPASLMTAADGIVPRSGSGARLLDAIVETCRDLRTRAAVNPMIVAFVAESSPEFSDVSRAQVVEALKASGASLWAIVLEDPARQLDADGNRERSFVLGDGTAQSGGLNKTVLSRQGIEPAFAVVAAAVSSRYDVTYSRPESLIPPSRIEVQVRNRGLRVLAPRWAPQ